MVNYFFRWQEGKLRRPTSQASKASAPSHALTKKQVSIVDLVLKREVRFNKVSRLLGLCKKNIKSSLRKSAKVHRHVHNSGHSASFIECLSDTCLS